MPDDRSELHTIEVRPLTPTIGAEVLGIDLGQPLTPSQFDQIHSALMRHLVIFFRDQHLSIEQHKAFGRRFGELDIHPTSRMEGHPEISTASNIVFTLFDHATGRELEANSLGALP